MPVESLREQVVKFLLVVALIVMPVGTALALDMTAAGGLHGGGQGLFTSVDAAGAGTGLWLIYQIRHGRPRPAIVISVLCAMSIGCGFVAFSSSLPWAIATNWVAILIVGEIAHSVSSRSDALLTAGSFLLAVGPAALHLPQDPGTIILTLLVLIASLTSLGIGLLVRAQNQKLAVERAMALSQVRRNMARELHDVIAHEIAGIIVLAQAAERHPSQAVSALSAIENSGSRAMSAIRAMVEALHGNAPSTLSPQSIEMIDLRNIISAYDETTAAAVQVEFPKICSTKNIPDPLLLVASRVLTEALTNIRRHAPDASNVHITIALDSKEFTLKIDDDGPLTPAKSPIRGAGLGNHTGLDGLRERVSIIGGTITWGLDTRRHWVLTARLPFEPDYDKMVER